jgi:hypothetical protein
VCRAVYGFHANDTGIRYIYDPADAPAYFHCHAAVRGAQRCVYSEG